METVKVLDWVLEVDRAATVEAHKKMRIPGPDGCSCLYCRNYYAAADGLPVEIIELCSVLGIDPHRPIEVYTIGDLKAGKQLYVGWHHLVGRIVQGQDSGSGAFDVPMSGTFGIGFTKAASLPFDWFPQPILELNFGVEMPWVLEEVPEITSGL